MFYYIQSRLEGHFEWSVLNTHRLFQLESMAQEEIEAIRNKEIKEDPRSAKIEYRIRKLDEFSGVAKGAISHLTEDSLFFVVYPSLDEDVKALRNFFFWIDFDLMCSPNDPFIIIDIAKVVKLYSSMPEEQKRPQISELQEASVLGKEVSSLMSEQSKVEIWSFGKIIKSIQGEQKNVNLSFAGYPHNEEEEDVYVDVDDGIEMGDVENIDWDLIKEREREIENQKSMVISKNDVQEMSSIFDKKTM